MNGIFKRTKGNGFSTLMNVAGKTISAWSMILSPKTHCLSFDQEEQPWSWKSFDLFGILNITYRNILDT